MDQSQEDLQGVSLFQGLSLSLEDACDILSTVGGVMINTVDCFIVLNYC